MAQIFVLVEHRQGKIRDITYEMLQAGETLASKAGGLVNCCALRP